MENPEDPVIEVLSEVNSSRGTEVPSDLLRRVYEIQKRHQNTKDREAPLEEMRKLVEGFVRDELAEKQE